MAYCARFFGVWLLSVLSAGAGQAANSPEAVAMEYTQAFRDASVHRMIDTLLILPGMGKHVSLERWAMKDRLRQQLWRYKLGGYHLSDVWRFDQAYFMLPPNVQALNYLHLNFDAVRGEGRMQQRYLVVQRDGRCYLLASSLKEFLLE